jgi:hypothetical protein
VPDEHRRLATLRALDNHRRVVLVARAGIVEREHRCHALVAAALELCDEQFPARIVVPRAVNQAERTPAALLTVSDRRTYAGLA